MSAPSLDLIADLRTHPGLRPLVEAVREVYIEMPARAPESIPQPSAPPPAQKPKRGLSLLRRRRSGE